MGGSLGRLRGSRASGLLGPPTHLRPDAIGADEDVAVRDCAVLEGRLDATAVAEVLIRRDARLDPDRALGEPVLDHDLLDDRTVDDDCCGEPRLERRPQRVEPH